MADANPAIEIELFLRNALREKAVEEKAITKALAALRPVLQRIERMVDDSGLLEVGPNREQRLRGLSVAIARMIRDDWGAPQLAELQADLAPFIADQMEFARGLVTSAGGSLAAPGAASLNTAAVVNNAIIGGKPLGTVLTSSLPATIADRVERYVRVGMIGDVEVRTFDAAVEGPTAGNVQAIFRTAVHESASDAQQAIFKVEADPAWLGDDGLIWTAILDSAVCPVCVALDGKRFPPEYVKVSPHSQCVLGDTEIDPGILLAGTRGVYSGIIVRLRTASGRVLGMTENHPVLTLDGWKPAKALKRGDQLIAKGGQGQALIDPNLNQPPATAEKLFGLLTHQPGVDLGRVPTAPVDFHGDGLGFEDGNVDIAVVNRQLLGNSNTVSLEDLREPLFVGTDSGLVPVDHLSAADALLLALHTTASGLVGGLDLAQALICGHLGPLESLGFALRARGDAGFDEPLADGATSHAQLLRDLVFAHSGAVEIDNVEDVNLKAESHVEVYDFSTLAGAYFANGILAHNCRCYLLPWKWRVPDMINPEGEKVPIRRPVEGDKGEDELPFKVAAKQWVKDNPETAQAIFGKRLGKELSEGRISFDKAVKQWSSKRSK